MLERERERRRGEKIDMKWVGGLRYLKKDVQRNVIKRKIERKRYIGRRERKEQ